MKLDIYMTLKLYILIACFGFVTCLVGGQVRA
jgi:hypothetical protein